MEEFAVNYREYRDKFIHSFLDQSDSIENNSIQLFKSEFSDNSHSMFNITNYNTSPKHTNNIYTEYIPTLVNIYSNNGLYNNNKNTRLNDITNNLENEIISKCKLNNYEDTKRIINLVKNEYLNNKINNTNIYENNNNFLKDIRLESDINFIKFIYDYDENIKETEIDKSCLLNLLQNLYSEILNENNVESKFNKNVKYKNTDEYVKKYFNPQQFESNEVYKKKILKNLLTSTMNKNTAITQKTPENKISKVIITNDYKFLKNIKNINIKNFFNKRNIIIISIVVILLIFFSLRK